MPEPLRRTVRLSTPPGDVDTVHDFLTKLWPDTVGVSDIDRISVETAVIELAANVMQHADSAGSGLACEFTIAVSDDAIEMIVRDTGDPGDIHFVDAEMPELEAESGRGLALIAALVEEVSYSRDDGHNLWRMRRARTTDA